MRRSLLVLCILLVLPLTWYGCGGDSGSGVPPSDPGGDVDTDGDGHLDADDNCPDISNPGQEDADQDSHGVIGLDGPVDHRVARAHFQRQDDPLAALDLQQVVLIFQLSRLKYEVKNTAKKPQLNAYACIYGSGKESAKLQFLHLELIPEFCTKISPTNSTRLIYHN